MGETQTDYERLTREIEKLGGRKVSTLCHWKGLRRGECYDFEVETWRLANRGLIITHGKKSDLVGLYVFVGYEHEPIERDIEFVRSLGGRA